MQNILNLFSTSLFVLLSEDDNSSSNRRLIEFSDMTLLVTNYVNNWTGLFFLPWVFMSGSFSRHLCASAISFVLELLFEDGLIKNVFASYSTLGSLKIVMESMIMGK
jgi:hypothetical protein